jgi:hypothetical protein
MKKATVLFFSFLFVGINVINSQSFPVTFDEKFGVTDQIHVFVPSAPQSDRLRSSKGGNIVPVINENEANDFHSLSYPIIQDAISLWCEQLYFKYDSVVNVTFQFENLDSEIAYRVINHYVPIDTLAYPLALIIALNGRSQGNSESITIQINNNRNLWYFEGDIDDIDNNISNNYKYNFKTAMLRAIAQVLGFRSSLNDMLLPRFQNMDGYKTKYDYSIVNSNNITLGSFTNNERPQIAGYAQGDNVYWKTAGTGYKIYAPTTYNAGVSLNYFDSQNELMSYDLKSNLSNYNIDSKTMQVLQDIGWNENNATITINCPDIDLTGLADVIDSYTFTASSSAGSITNHHWEYRIKKKDGSFSVISSSYSNSFSIAPLSNISPDYMRNSEGDVVGEIYLSAKVNGTDKETSFNIYLKTKPSNIEYTYKINRLSDWEFNVKISLHSKGAESFVVSTVVWNAGFMFTRNHAVSQYIKFTSLNFYYGEEVQFRFKASNQYGQQEVYFDLPYQDPFASSNFNVPTKQTDAPIIFPTVNSIDIYSIMGIYIGTVNSKEKLFEKCKSGIFILKYKDAENKELHVEKIKIR